MRAGLFAECAAMPSSSLMNSSEQQIKQSQFSSIHREVNVFAFN